MRDKLLKFCEKVLTYINFKDICLLSLICFLSMKGMDRHSPILSFIAHVIYVLSCITIFLFGFALQTIVYMDITKHTRRDK